MMPTMTWPCSIPKTGISRCTTGKHIFLGANRVVDLHICQSRQVTRLHLSCERFYMMISCMLVCFKVYMYRNPHRSSLVVISTLICTGCISFSSFLWITYIRLQRNKLHTVHKP